ncbi:MAG: class I SAM-dependent methyltransferase [Planctomycetota bacterium]
MLEPPTVAEVKQANRRLYDSVADDYEAIDGRRDEKLLDWIRTRLRKLAEEHGNAVLLDLGSGSGAVTKAARGIFERSIATDISPGIIAAAGPVADVRLAADSDALPLADGVVNVVSCFAVLHHLCDTSRLAREVARVLKRGGVFWSDHDMDLAFHRRFRWPLAGYRWLRGADRHYCDAGIDAETYALAECREDGVDAALVLRELRAAGLDARAEFHWFGLTPWADRLFGDRVRPRGWAPLLRILATKPA